jgi:chromate transporter
MGADGAQTYGLPGAAGLSVAAMSPPAPAPPPVAAPSLLELFTAFALISLYAFGGVLAWSRRMLVDERKWMTPAEFNDAYALCQFLPGPNVVNLSVVFGQRFRGVPGSVAALVGLLGPPFIIVTLIGALYARYGEIATLQRMLIGVALAACGLVFGTAAKMARPMLKDQGWIAPLVALAAFVGIGVMRWPIYIVLVILVPVSIALAWWARR